MLFPTLLITAVLAINGVLAQTGVKTSHCPQVLAYDGIEPKGTRYNANILIRTRRPLNGFKMDIELDRPVQLLGNSVGEVETNDNRYFSIISKKVVKPRPPFSLQVFIKYPSGGDIPYIKSILLDGLIICAPENTEEEAIQKIPSREVNTGRPINQVTDRFGFDNFDSTTPSRPRPTTTTTDPQPGRTEKDAATTSRPGTSTAGGASIECGKIHIPVSVPLITNAEESVEGQWPWHIAIYRADSKTGNLNYNCGGTLISRRTMITAAHCVADGSYDRPVNASTLRVLLGKYHLTRWEAGVAERGIAEVIVHPTYNASAGYVDDIAILKFATPVEFTHHIRPVCMWDRAKIDFKEVEDKKGKVAGWGINEAFEFQEVLMMASLPVVDHFTCILSKKDHFIKFLRITTFCAGDPITGTSACNGDSGGGMVFPTRQSDGSTKWYLRGLVSNGVPKPGVKLNPLVCDPKYYTVFTDVAQYLDWIDPYIRD